ncbi:hypothetical protein BF17_22210 [Yersinia similis]|uniref:Uncharacterized protein n=1 Tax=Yersinia similis TaxID=367190 RepID=A0ABM5Q482_9GAMM|nr:hypothetical protein BF17_22210 [Yersinia similis]
MQPIHYLLIISAVVNNKPSIHNINLTKMSMTSNFLISTEKFQPILIFNLCPEIKKDRGEDRIKNHKLMIYTASLWLIIKYSVWKKRVDRICSPAG